MTVTRIALFLPSLEGGGAERVFVHLANGLLRYGVAVDMVLAFACGPYLTQLDPAVHLVDLGKRRVLPALPGLIRYLRLRRPAVALSAMPHCNLALILATRLVRPHIPCIVTEHMTFAPAFFQFACWKDRLLLPWLWLYAYADLTVTVSHGAARNLARRSGLAEATIRVIYNPVVPDNLPELMHATVSHPWLTDNAGPVIMGMGRLIPEKDFATLIRALPLVRRERPGRLLIFGEGPERQRLCDLIARLDLQNFAQLPGFVANPFACMSKAAVVAVASRFESFCNVLAEAIACGTPVVSTDCESGPAEILAHGRYGPLVPPENPQALAEAIVNVLDHPVPAATLQARGQEFSVERAVADYWAEITSLLPGNAAP